MITLFNPRDVNIIAILIFFGLGVAVGFVIGSMKEDKK